MKVINLAPIYHFFLFNKYTKSIKYNEKGGKKGGKEKGGKKGGKEKGGKKGGKEKGGKKKGGKEKGGKEKGEKEKGGKKRHLIFYFDTKPRICFQNH